MMSKRLFLYGAFFSVALWACDHNREWELGYLRSDSKPGDFVLAPVDGDGVSHPDGWDELPMDSLFPSSFPPDSLSADSSSADLLFSPSKPSSSDTDSHFFHPQVAGWEEEALEIRLN